MQTSSADGPTCNSPICWMAHISKGGWVAMLHYHVLHLLLPNVCKQEKKLGKTFIDCSGKTEKFDD